jgi:hypothetical protein
MAFPLISASATVCLAWWRIRPNVARETPMHCPESSWDNPSKSANLRASRSSTVMHTSARSTIGIPRGLKKLISGLNATRRSFLGLPMRPPIKQMLGDERLFSPVSIDQPFFPGGYRFLSATADHDDRSWKAVNILMPIFARRCGSAASSQSSQRGRLGPAFASGISGGSTLGLTRL